MIGDFSRDTSSVATLARYTRVLLQQGRPLLDADFNEQSAIHHDFLRTLAADLLGRGWRPTAKQFVVERTGTAFTLTKGHFYVDGILCDNPKDQVLGSTPTENFVALLECWERCVSPVQQPALREIALGGIDTAARAQVAWRVVTVTKDEATVQAGQLGGLLTKRIEALPPGDEKTHIEQLRAGLPALTTAFSGVLSGPPDASDDEKTHDWFDAMTAAVPRLRAQARQTATDDEACVISPQSQYRGRENQLYRVEIHDGSASGTATFKWSRENGSVMFAIRGGLSTVEKDGMLVLKVPLETLGRDRRTGLCKGDWVELTDDLGALGGATPPLGKIEDIHPSTRTVTVLAHKDAKVNGATLLRRWDQVEHVTDRGTLEVKESQGVDDAWFALERGIRIQFQPGGLYRRGDYWLIPARVASGDVQWPQENKQPAFVQADGIARHHSVIGVQRLNNGQWKGTDLGRTSPF